MAELKPVWPPCDGRQHAPDIDAGHYFDVHYDENNNEIADDKPMHENTTPGMGSFNYGAKHYANEFKSYGTEVGGGSPSRTEVSVQGDAAKRGDES